MKVVRNRFQLMERYDGHGEEGVGRCDSCHDSCVT